MADDPTRNETPGPPAEPLHRRLEEFCRAPRGFGPQARVRDLARVPGGWECETWAFTLEGADDAAGAGGGSAQAAAADAGGGSAQAASPASAASLILRLYADESAARKADREFRSMLRLHELGYPVPRVLRLEPQGDALGRPFLLMERVEGEVLGALLPRMQPEERERELDRLCRLLFRLHALPAEAFLDLVPGIDPSDARGPLRRVRRSLSDAIADHRLAGFLPVLDWLGSREASLACPRLSAAHLDFHPYNVIRSPDDRLIVLDWTAFTVTDARLDLAWTLVLAHSFEGEGLRARILRGYEAAAGTVVAGIGAFEAAACVRRLVDLVVSLESGPEARGMRPEAISAMRKMEGAHRRVYELLQERTGLRVPEVERMLAGLGQARR